MDPETPKWLEQATHRRLIVHTVTDQSFEGILRLAAQDGLLLWNASIPHPEQPVKLEGEVFIPRNQVLFVQTVRM